jgi:hypothetical protein
MCLQVSLQWAGLNSGNNKVGLIYALLAPGALIVNVSLSELLAGLTKGK